MKDKLMLVVPMLHQGGFERVCVTTARLLEPYFDITIVIFDSSDIAYDVSGLHIIDLHMGVRQGRLQKLLNMFRRGCKLKALKKELQPKAAYSFGATANLVNSLSRYKQTKTILGLRSYMDMEEVNKIRFFVKRADMIICCSRVIEQELGEKYHFHKAVTLYNPFNVEQIREDAAKCDIKLPWSEEDGINFISMGREDDIKGFWHMLKVFSCVHKEIPNTHLIILGEGSFEEYRQLARDLKLDEVVYFAGLQTQPYCYLQKGAVYLLTSFHEGFPNALVEGMALGLAAVSTNCKTGPEEILSGGKYGILVPVMDSRKNLDANEITEEERNMAAIVIKLLSDHGLLEQYRKAAIERAHDFSYESYVENLVSYIN